MAEKWSVYLVSVAAPFLCGLKRLTKRTIPPQQIQYAKSKSDTIAKLDGTFRMPSAAAGEVTATELQQSIFNAPPSAAPPAPIAAGILKPPTTGGELTMEDARSPASAAGQKRRRDEAEEEEEEDSEGDVAMEEDSDDD